MTNQVLLDVIRCNKILFLENDPSTLDDALLNFRMWCVENKIVHNILYSLDKLPLDYIKSQILSADIITFQTTGIASYISKLYDFILSMKTDIKIIECYVHQPIFDHLPKEAKKNIKMWMLDSYEDNISAWKIKKLTRI